MLVIFNHQIHLKNIDEEYMIFQHLKYQRQQFLLKNLIFLSFLIHFNSLQNKFKI